MNFLLGTWWLWIIAEIIIVIVTIRIATSKNYSGVLAFLLCLCVPMFGALIIVALLPDKVNISGIAKPNSGTKANPAHVVDAPSDDTWLCKKCGQKNPSTESACKGCGTYR
jgi:hypothetical protein